MGIAGRLAMYEGLRSARAKRLAMQVLSIYEGLRRTGAKWEAMQYAMELRRVSYWGT